MKEHGRRVHRVLVLSRISLLVLSHVLLEYHLPPPQPATSCNPIAFPVEKYIISIAGVQGSLTIAGDQSDTITILLTSTDFPGLDSDSEYTIFVQACAWFACQTAMPATLGEQISRVLGCSPGT